MTSASMRFMRGDELDALTDLAKRSDPHAWGRNSIEQSFLSGHLCWILEAESLIGFVVFQTVLDESELLYLVIDQRFQQQGQANLLLSNACKKLLEQGITCVFLEVRESNVNARAFYQRMGFQACGWRKNYYLPLSGSNAEAENALLLRLTLVP